VNSTGAHCKRLARNAWPPLRRNSASKGRCGAACSKSSRVLTGIHHHDERQTIAYVLSGICKVRWGANGEFAACAEAGDFIHVPAFLPRMEISPSDSQPFRRVVVRSTQLRSWSIFQRTRSDRFQTPGKWPRVRHLTMTRDDGSKLGTKAPSHG
jgi:hypothetical protein